MAVSWSLKENLGSVLGLAPKAKLNESTPAFPEENARLELLRAFPCSDQGS
jgi:hypothetical protein